MKYVKLNLTFGDKLKMLLFGLVPEDKLPVKEVVREAIVENEIRRVYNDHKEVINTKDDEKFHVPFFELQDDDVKSNF